MNTGFIYPLQYNYFTQKPPRKMFSPHEDVIIVTLASQQEKKDWKYIASHLPGRTPRQVRERFRNHLSPGLENGPWTREEDDLLRKLFKEYGSKWSLISSYFKSRSDTNVKNRWNSIAKMSAKMNSLKKTDVASIKNASSKQVQTTTKVSTPLNQAEEKIKIEDYLDFDEADFIFSN